MKTELLIHGDFKDLHESNSKIELFSVVNRNGIVLNSLQPTKHDILLGETKTKS